MLLGYPNSWLDRQIFRDENETFRDACVCVCVCVCKCDKTRVALRKCSLVYTNSLNFSVHRQIPSGAPWETFSS